MKFLTYIISIIAICLALSCEDSGYDIEYQAGYPNRLAGNWVAYDYEITKENYNIVLDTINDFDLLNEFAGFSGLLDIISQSDEYDLVTALDPNNQNMLVLNNIYNSGVRSKAEFSDQLINSRLSEQLDVINHGGYGIYYVSLSGQLIEDPDGDVLCIVVGLYDSDMELYDSLFILAYRKTGFEDTEYQSLLNK